VACAAHEIAQDQYKPESALGKAMAKLSMRKRKAVAFCKAVYPSGADSKQL
jgi:hypothetical protein